MTDVESSNPYEAPGDSPEPTPRRHRVHLLTLVSLLCVIPSIPWTILITLSHERDLRALPLQLIFMGVGAAGTCAGLVSLWKRYAVSLFDRLLACVGMLGSFAVLVIAALIPWLDAIERAWMEWSQR